MRAVLLLILCSMRLSAAIAGCDPAWSEDAPKFEADVHAAVIAGVAKGKHAAVQVRVGGQAQAGGVASASEQQLGIAIGGTELRFGWDGWTKNDERYLIALARAYAGDDAKSRARIARYALVRGWLPEAQADLDRALALDPTLLKDADFKAIWDCAKAAQASAAAEKPAPPAKKPDEAAKPAKAKEPALWRPFNDQSPWNARIGKKPELDPDSAKYVQDLATSCSLPELFVNIKSYSINVAWADAKTPRQVVPCRDIRGLDFDKPIPIPTDAAASDGTDKHLCVIDRAAGWEYGMWYAQKGADGKWTCGVGAAMDLSGTGVRPLAAEAGDWKLAHGARASGFPLIAGLILADEIKAGRIEHALVLNYPHTRSVWYCSPASTAQGTTKECLPDRGLPCGAHLQLDPELDLETLGLSRAGLIIARALQDYGAFVGDYSGAITLNADGSAQACSYWDGGVLDNGAMRKLPMRSFRVLKLGKLYDK